MISDHQRQSLHNLAAKQAGEEVDWINIADARALTELGLARRNRGGWEITPAGQALLRGPPDGPILVQDNDPSLARPSPLPLKGE
jgi:hypothetical protein